MQIDLITLNKILASIDTIRRGKAIETKPADGENYDEGYEIYSLKSFGFDDLLIQITIVEDSYGSNEYVSKVQFGQLKSKEVKVFEPLI